MKNKEYNHSGITLIALMITVVVLLILASVATYSGIEAIENSKYTKFKAELKIMQSYINNWYEECKPSNENETFAENIAAKFTNIAGKGVNATVATSDTQAVTTLNAIGITNETSQSNYYVLKNDQKEALGIDNEGVTQDVLVSIVDRKVVSYLGLKYKDQMYYTLDDLGEFYNVDYDGSILNNNSTKPIIAVSGRSVYNGETAKGAKYRFKVDVTYKAPYVDKGNLYYSKLDSNNNVTSWNKTSDKEILVDRNGKYRFYYVDAAGNTSDSVDYVVEPKARLIDGTNFNVKMKSLAGENNPNVDTVNTSITSFKFSTEKPSNDILTDNTKKVSATNSIYDIFMWRENGTIYLWSDDNWIYTSSNCYSMFRNLKSITNIDLYFLNTSNTTVMTTMFYNCCNLTNLDLSSFNTSNVTLMNNMIQLCSNLKSIDISSFNTEKVTTMIAMFYGCSNLKELNLSNFNTKDVTNMSGMFYNCTNLNRLDLSSFNTEKVTTMAHMFYNCSKLVTLKINRPQNAVATTMQGMFYSCSGLTSLDLTDFKTNNSTNMNTMFCNCGKLTNLDLTSFDTSNVTDMKSMFYNCQALTSLNLSNFNTSSVTDMSNMFFTCNHLTNLNISNFNTQNVTNMSLMFRNCLALTNLDLASFDTHKVINMFQMFWNCPNLNKIYASNNFVTTALSNEQIVDQPEGNTTSNQLFSGCTSLVGGSGTTYDANHVDADYAHIDGGPSNPGYFTRKTSSI